MRILYACTKFDYGKPELGHSFEHYNFYDSLMNLGHDIVYFDFMGLMARHGQAVMNRRLAEVVDAEKPDLLFCSLLENQLDKAIVRKISDSGKTVTVNWFCDDHWRFDNFSRFWAPNFNWVVTTSAESMPKYLSMGYQHAIKSQWACNHFRYRQMDVPMEYDVTFVGAAHGNRPAFLAALKQAGVSVRAFGNEQEADELIIEQMLKIFNSSRINLNLANSSFATPTTSRRMKQSARGIAGKILRSLPGGSTLKGAIKTALGKNAAIGATPTSRFAYGSQIKGRNFEVPGCGGFLLTEPADNLEQYYALGKEIQTFDGIEDAIRLVGEYLSNEGKRKAIARAGYERTIAEHTYKNRFEAIFDTIGLPILPAGAARGETTEVL